MHHAARVVDIAQHVERSAVVLVETLADQMAHAVQVPQHDSTRIIGQGSVVLRASEARAQHLESGRLDIECRSVDSTESGRLARIAANHVEVIASRRSSSPARPTSRSWGRTRVGSPNSAMASSPCGTEQRAERAQCGDLVAHVMQRQRRPDHIRRLDAIEPAGHLGQLRADPTVEARFERCDVRRDRALPVSCRRRSPARRESTSPARTYRRQGRCRCRAPARPGVHPAHAVQPPTRPCR